MRVDWWSRDLHLDFDWSRARANSTSRAPFFPADPQMQSRVLGKEIIDSKRHSVRKWLTAIDKYPQRYDSNRLLEEALFDLDIDRAFSEIEREIEMDRYMLEQSPQSSSSTSHTTGRDSIESTTV